MSVFDNVASAYDRGMLGLELLLLRRLRRRLWTFAQGRVLDLGTGTGANLGAYPPSAYVIAVDLSAEMLGYARSKSHQATVKFVQANVQSLPFASQSFDHVVSSLLFCSTENPLAGLQEIARVLKPGGRLLMIEHVRGHLPLTRWLTDLLDPLWFRMNGSCHLNRETAQTVAQAGLNLLGGSQHLGGIFEVICAEKSPASIAQAVTSEDY